jgi:hypothetical protein
MPRYLHLSVCAIRDEWLACYSSSHGKAERKLAADFEAKAKKLDETGYALLAATMRSLAESYVRQAEREEKEDPSDTE